MALLHPESDISMSSIALGANILKILRDTKKPIIVDELMERFLRADKRRTQANFFIALNFLYMVGTIDKDGYRIKLISNLGKNPLQNELNFTE